VLIATAFVHVCCSQLYLLSFLKTNISKLLPTAFQSLNDPCLPDLFTKKYPALPGVIGLGALFSLFSIEMWMHSKMPHGHSHGSATGEEFAGGPQRVLPPPPAPPAPRAVSPEGSAPFPPTYLDEKRMIDE
jgi:zinc transporter 1/2/3